MAPKFSLIPFRDRQDKKVALKQSISAPMPIAAPAGQLGRRPLADLSTNTSLPEVPLPPTISKSVHLGRSVSDVGTSWAISSPVKAQADVPSLLPSTVYSPPPGLTKTAESTPTRPAFLDSLFAVPIPKPSTSLPCSAGLTHRLAYCGHLVRTDRPEACAPNCHDVWTHIGEPSIDEMMNHFVCLQCIEAEIIERDRKRRESFEEQHEHAETALGYPLAIRQREFKLENQLLQDEQKDVDDLVDAGRPCFPVYEQVQSSLPGMDKDEEEDQASLQIEAHESRTIDDEQESVEQQGDDENPGPDFIERYHSEYEVAFATQVPIHTGAKEVYIEPKSSSSTHSAGANESGSSNAGADTASEDMTAPPSTSNPKKLVKEKKVSIESRGSSSRDSAAASELGFRSAADDTASEDVTAPPSASNPKKLRKERKVSGRFWRRAHKDIHKWF